MYFKVLLIKKNTQRSLYNSIEQMEFCLSFECSGKVQLYFVKKISLNCVRKIIFPMRYLSSQK